MGMADTVMKHLMTIMERITKPFSCGLNEPHNISVTFQNIVAFYAISVSTTVNL